MPLAEFLAELDQLCREAQSAFDSAGDAAALEAARIEFLGMKSGRSRRPKKVSARSTGPTSRRPESGSTKSSSRSRRHSKRPRRGWPAAPKATAAGPQFDPTVPGIRPRIGHLHPLTQTIEELKDIMGRLGFTVADGPEVEDEWHNFEALNIPAEHPARDPLENFYLATAAKLGAGSITQDRDAGSMVKPQAVKAKELLLRSQTSTVQIRVMEKTPPPVRIISLGRVYRPDDADATHYPMFHQIEGLLVDRGVTMADLKSVLAAVRPAVSSRTTCTSASAPRSSPSPSRAWKWT